MPRNHDIIEVEGKLYQETAAAYLFSDGRLGKPDEYGNKFPVKVWLPKSQCEWELNANSKDCGIMQMPEWLALEKGLI